MDRANELTLREKLDYYRWPIGIILFFFVLVIVNGHLVWVAFENSQDEIVSSPYQKGVLYQQIIDQRSLSKELGLSVEIQAAKGDGSQRSITASFDKHETAPDILSTRIRFYYPQTGEFDAEHSLTPSTNLSFSTQANLPLTGLCMADIWIETEKGTALLKERFWIES